jgi:hypothetical protein
MGERVDGLPSATRRFVRVGCVLGLLLIAVLAVLPARADAFGPLKLTEVTTADGHTGVTWTAPEGGTEWGYKLGISGCEAEKPEPACRKTQYFEVQKSEDPQSYVVYPENLREGLEGKVWIGVAVRKVREGTEKLDYSEELTMKIGARTKVPFAAPDHIWSEGDVLHWGSVGDGLWGYQAAVSTQPPCFTPSCRPAAVPFDVQNVLGPTYVACKANLGGSETVYVKVGSSLEEGDEPISWTGNEVPVTVSPCPPPIVRTEAASGVTKTSATLNAAVNPNGSTVDKCEFQYGITTEYGKKALCVVPGKGTSPVLVGTAVTDLAPGTVYHYKVLASGPEATAEPGEDRIVRTENPNKPAAITDAATSPAQTSAVFNGRVNPNGGATECYFEYGDSTSYDKSVPCRVAPGGGAGVVGVDGAAADLAPETTYHYRLVATNAGGVAAGKDETVRTANKAPPPPPPVNLVRPKVLGPLIAGEAAEADPGVWEHQASSFSYRWFRCDTSGKCSEIVGSVGFKLPLTNEDIGNSLRVEVTARNDGGTAAVQSLPSGAVGSVVSARVEKQFARVGSSITVDRFQVVGIPAGATVQLLCKGPGCTFSHKSAKGCSSRRCKQQGSTADLARLFKKRLRKGAVITVRVVKPGWIGHFEMFTVRAKRTDQLVRCLHPGSTAPYACS